MAKNNYMHLAFQGNLGSDPTLRYTPDGTPVTNFSVAYNRSWNNPDGSKGEETTWFRVTVWRRLAEVCNQYLKKGREVIVEGRLNPDENGGPRIWNGNDGQARANFEVTASRIVFLGSKGDDNTQPAVAEDEEIDF